MTPRKKRFKLLLDEMMPRREKFPLLNNFHNVKHVVHDLGKSGDSDTQIVAIARRQQRIILTKNIKHFRELCHQENVDLIGVSDVTGPEKLDKIIMARLKRRRARKMTGKFTKVVA